MITQITVHQRNRRSLLWVRILWFQWCTVIRVILDWSVLERNAESVLEFGSPILDLHQRNTPPSQLKYLKNQARGKKNLIQKIKAHLGNRFSILLQSPLWFHNEQDIVSSGWKKKKNVWHGRDVYRFIYLLLYILWCCVTVAWTHARSAFNCRGTLKVKESLHVSL